MPTYTFGPFQLNAASNGLGYFLVGKELPTPVVKPVTFNIGRRDGLKKSGESVDARSIMVTLKVVGTSRVDLISRLDALQAALARRSQALCIHEDGRYYQSVDAISAPVKFAAGGGVVQCEVQIAFTAYDPYAYAASLSTYDSGTVALTSASGQWNFPAIVLTGGGSTYSLPFIRLYNRTSTGSTTLSSGLTSGNHYTSLAVAATTFSGKVGDTIILSNGTNTQMVTIATAFSSGATSITVSSFQANANYTTSSTATKNTQWTGLTITQSNDSQTLTATSTTAAPLPLNSDDYVDIQCDPAATNGWSIITNGNGIQINPVGVFPVMEPGSTTFGIGIASGSAVSAEAVLSWLPRYMS